MKHTIETKGSKTGWRTEMSGWLPCTPCFCQAALITWNLAGSS